MASNVSLQTLTKVRINIYGRCTCQEKFHVQTLRGIHTCWSTAVQPLHTVPHGSFTQLPHAAMKTWSCHLVLPMWKFLMQYMDRTSVFELRLACFHSGVSHAVYPVWVRAKALGLKEDCSKMLINNGSIYHYKSECKPDPKSFHPFESH